ncbi:MAG: magnesium transporter [Anaerolineaceae bacterium]|nr:magnesium transporter [Anaerolineaceae bacterium]
MAGTEQTFIDEIMIQLKNALSEGDWDGAVALLEPLRPPDQASLFDDLHATEQDQLLPRLNPEDSADILEELEEDNAVEIAERQAVKNLAPIIDSMEPDEAADLLGDIDPHRANELLSAMQETEEVITLMTYADDTAGGMMTAIDFALKEEMTAEEAISFLRQQSPDAEEIYYLFVIDDGNHLVGVVSLRQLIIEPPDSLIAEIMDDNIICIQAEADQEDAARLMTRYDLLALPVIDDQNHLLGLITYDDSSDVLEEEATEDIYRLGGVPEGQVMDVKVTNAMRSRLPWLALNLVTALASATVLSLFESTIAQVAALAAFFPIVAGVSGSAATQTLTVTVRGLALGQIESRDALPTLGRELLLGIVNGISIGGLVAVIALVWKGTPTLGLVVGAATLLTMISAAIAGVIVPLGLEKLNIDPALASPILVTTATDTFGYLVYLGMATAAIGLLL